MLMKVARLHRKTYSEAGWLLASLLYCGLIFYASSRSTLPTPYVFSGQDKLIHATAYAVMAVLFWHAAIHRCRAKLLPWLVVTICAAYGISDEWHQSFVMGRDASAWDWLADVSGATVASMLLFRWEAQAG
jgi:VanZ family protein